MRAVIGKAVKPRIDLNAEIEPAVYARLFLECLAEEGVSASEVLAGTGLSPVDLAEYEKLISIAQQIRIYANIAQLSDNPTVGLSQGQKILPHHHGVWGYAMQTSANLGQAIRVFNQYFDVAGPIARQFLQVNGTVARWVSTDVLPTEPARRVAVEEMLAGNLTLFKHLSDGKFRLKALHLDYARPEGHTAYDELFQCPVLFDQDTIEMRFNASLLNLKLKYADADTKRVCEERCGELLDRLGSFGNIIDRVRKIIYENPCDRRDVNSVASKLCMSPRTLRRHLKNESTTFRLVLNEVREAVAVDYLCSTELSMDEIGFLVGYSETSNFRHAFKNWTGESPTSYRKQRRNQPADHNG